MRFPTPQNKNTIWTLGKHMHELGLCAEMVRTLEDIMKKEKLSSIKEISLDIGEATGVLPRFMTECWAEASKESKLKGSALKINLIPARGICQHCHTEYELSKHNKCPECGYGEMEQTSGFEFEITEIQGE